MEVWSLCNPTFPAHTPQLPARHQKKSPFKGLSCSGQRECCGVPLKIHPGPNSCQLWLTAGGIVNFLELLPTKAGQMPLGPKLSGVTPSTAGPTAPGSAFRRYFFPIMTVTLSTFQEPKQVSAMWPFKCVLRASSVGHHEGVTKNSRAGTAARGRPNLKLHR